jgi:Flp pilus assembly protein CpaB
MLCVALVCGGLAVSEVRERERRAELALGAVGPVVVAQRDLPAGRRLRSGDLAIRRAPLRFVPPDALRAARGLAGARLAAPLAAGSYLTAGLLAGAADDRSGLRPGERSFELAVAGGSALAGLSAGARVDVVVSTPGDTGGGHTFAALENVELLALRAHGGAAPDGGALPDAEGGSLLATLRVSAREAVYLAAAADFAQRVRLLVRPAGDRGRIGAGAVGADGL